jgi:hypothetical protein
MSSKITRKEDETDAHEIESLRSIAFDLDRPHGKTNGATGNNTDLDNDQVSELK